MSTNLPQGIPIRSASARAVSALVTALLYTSSAWAEPVLQGLELPQELVEEARLVPLDSAEAISFDQAMHELMQRLHPEYDFKANPLAFVISTDQTNRDFYTRQGNIPAIAISVHTLRAVSSLDELVAIVGHEFHHHLLDLERGMRQNSKAEEWSADLVPLSQMARSGMNPEAALRLARRDYNRAPTFSQLIDVHPLDRTRAKSIENAVAAIRAKHGKFNPETELPEALKQIAKNASSESYIEKAKRLADWQRMSTLDRLSFLSQTIGDTTDWNRARRIDLGRALRELSIDRNVTALRAAQDQLADQILDLKDVGTRDYLYKFLSNTITDWEPALAHRKVGGHVVTAHPIGRLIPIESAIRRFIRSKDIESAEQHAKALLDRTAQLDTSLSKLVDWSTFRFPDKEKFKQRRRRGPVEVSWNRFVEWARSTPNGSIGKALLALNVQDLRLYDYLDPSQTLLNIVNARNPSFAGPRDGSQTITELTIDESGRVVRWTDTPTKPIEPLQPYLVNAVEQMFDRAAEGDVGAKKQLTEFLQISPAQPDTTTLIGSRHMQSHFDLFFEINAPAIANSLPAWSEFFNRLREFAKSDDLEKQNVVRTFYLDGTARHLYRNTIAQAKSERPIVENPLLDLVYENPNHIFTPAEQQRAIELYLTADWIEIFVFDYPSAKGMGRLRQILDYAAPTTGAELSHLVSSLNKDGRRLSHQAAFTEVAAFFRDHKPERITGFDLIDFLCHYDLSALAPDSLFRDHLRKYIAKYFEWPKETKRAVDAWQLIHSAGLFKTGTNAGYDKLKTIIDAIAGIEAPDARLKLLQALLSGRRIQEPTLRELVFDMFVTSAFDSIGLDDGTYRYSAQITQRVSGLNKKLNLVDRTVLFARLAERVQSQGLLSKKLKGLLTHLDNTELEQTQQQGVTAEALFGLLGGEEDGRKVIVDFLIAPLSPRSIDRFAEESIDILARIPTSENMTLVYARKDMTRRFIKLHADIGWRDFWQAKFEARALILDSLLFPHPDPSSQQIDEVLSYCLQKLLPFSEPRAEDARRFLQAYFKVLPDYQKKVFLSAILVANEKHQASRELSRQINIGERLAIVFELMGPAETKLGQRIHSHPQTPLDIKSGMRRLKSSASPPLRWDLIALYEQAVPQEVRRNITRIKQILGSASYYVVFEVEMADGSEKVLRVLRPHALERAENGFETLEKMLEHLQTELPPNVVSIVGDMIREAKSMAKIETDSALTSTQYQHAQQLYDGAKFTVGDQTFTMHVPQVHSFGPRYTLSDKAPGVHFNDLPELSPDQRTHKERIAKGYLAWELHLITRGGRFDRDRHGDQMRVSGNDLYILDPGGMALDEPTPAERKQLGEAILEVALEVQGGHSLTEALFKLMSEKQAAGHGIRYLISVQDSLLALQDFQSYVRPEEGLQILKVVFEAGAHPDVITAIKSGALQRMLRADTSALALVQKLSSADTASACKDVLILHGKQQ